MGTSSSFAQAAAKLDQLSVAVERLPRQTGNAVGRLGDAEVRRLAVDVFGGDRRFSGAKRSRKAKRVASARYKVIGDSVEIYPTGDPFYIFMKGRGGGKRIYPRRRGTKALGGPGGPRAWSVVGRLAPRPNLLDPAVTEIRRKAPRVVDEALQDAIRRVL